MDLFAIIKIAKLVKEGITYLCKNEYDYESSKAHVYYESLNIANNYLEVVKDKHPSEVNSIIRSACQHLETAFATGYRSETTEMNDLILSIIRLHFVLEDDYSVINFWTKKIWRALEPDEELKRYIKEEDFQSLKNNHWKYEKEMREAWESERESREAIQDIIDYANSNWGGFP